MKKEDFLNKWIDALPLNSKDNDRKEMEYDLNQVIQNQTKEDWISVEEKYKLLNDYSNWLQANGYEPYSSEFPKAFMIEAGLLE